MKFRVLQFTRKMGNNLNKEYENYKNKTTLLISENTKNVYLPLNDGYDPTEIRCIPISVNYNGYEYNFEPIFDESCRELYYRTIFVFKKLSNIEGQIKDHYRLFSMEKEGKYASQIYEIRNDFHKLNGAIFNELEKNNETIIKLNL
jgi:hypothetical protein